MDATVFPVYVLVDCFEHLPFFEKPICWHQKGATLQEVTALGGGSQMLWIQGIDSGPQTTASPFSSRDINIEADMTHLPGLSAMKWGVKLQ